jgi:prepilin-type N-terminal cleavage/methylation domain-containing protein
MLSPQIKPARGTHSTLSGYSLPELAIVLAIIGLNLVAGMTLSVGKVQINVAEVQGTKERLEIIREALLLFQKKYERYPWA